MRHGMHTDDRVRGKSVEERVRSATGGSRDVDGAPEGGAVRRVQHEDPWMYCDEMQAKQGLIDPTRGEMYFRPDDENNRPRSDRSYRTSWRPASDVLRGTVVKMPYSTS